jgi:uncharacterized membrane protein YbhN (UPF0104 family)
VAGTELTGAEPAPSHPGRSRRKRIVLGVLGAAVAVGTFAYVLPQIASYQDVWDVVRNLSWGWIVALLAATALNLATFAPPWMVALPGLRFLNALVMTQASTAVSIVFPGGAAVGMASSFAMLRSWGFAGGAVGRAVTLTGIWNQFANLAFPILAVALLAVNDARHPLLTTVAFVGLGVLGIAIAGLALVFASESLAHDLGDVAADLTNRVLRRLRRGPVGWSGDSFVRFRRDSLDLLRRRWHLLTITTLLGHLTVFLLLVLSLRALDVPASQVTLVEAFAAWALVRILGAIPLTPGGIGIVELGLTGALVSFGGASAGVVAAVLVYRFLTVVPTLVLGLVAGIVFRRLHPETGASSPAPEGPGGAQDEGDVVA